MEHSQTGNQDAFNFPSVPQQQFPSLTYPSFDQSVLQPTLTSQEPMPTQPAFNSPSHPSWQATETSQSYLDLFSIPSQGYSLNYPLSLSNSVVDSTTSGTQTLNNSTFSAHEQYLTSVSTAPRTAQSMNFGSAHPNAAKRPIGSSSELHPIQPKRRKAEDPLEAPDIRDMAEFFCNTCFNKFAAQGFLPPEDVIDAFATLRRKDPRAVREEFCSMLKDRWVEGVHVTDSAYQSAQSGKINSQPQPSAEGSILVDDEVQRTSNHGRSAPSSSQSLIQRHERKPRNGKPRVRRRRIVLCHRTHRAEDLERVETHIYQCTRKCGKRFIRRDNWKRHQLIAEPQDGWLCMVDLFTLRGETRLCKLCEATNVDAEHFKSNHREVFESRRATNGGCGKLILPGRRDHFTQHFRGRHAAGEHSLEEIERISHFKIEYNGGWRCGFCSDSNCIFTRWDNWFGHVAAHFESGMAIKDWMDDLERPEPCLSLSLGSYDDDSSNGSDGPSGHRGAGGRGPTDWPANLESSDSDDEDEDHGGGADGQRRHAGGTERQHQAFRPTAERLPADGPRLLVDLPSLKTIVSSRKLGQQTARFLAATGDSIQNNRIRGDCPPSAVQAQPPDSYVREHRGGNSRSATALEITERGKTRRPSHGSVAIAPENNQMQPVSVEECLPSISRAGNSSMSTKSLMATMQPFRRIRLLGSGSYSIVEEVLHLPTQLRYARKSSRPGKESLQSHLMMEMQTLQSLRHRHIIRFFDWFSTGHSLSIILSPVAESNLAQYLEAVVPPSDDSRAHLKRFFGCLVSALLYIHQSSFTHGDIKPLNVLITAEKTPNVMLCDFGASRRSTGALKSNIQDRPLTWKYCAPEVVSHQSRDTRADIWSLGCVFLEIAAVLYAKPGRQLRDFRANFSGNVSYHQMGPKISHWLDIFESQAPCDEGYVTSTIRAMLSVKASDRPDATSLFLRFPPNECCLSWLPHSMSIGSSFQALYALSTIRTMPILEHTRSSSFAHETTEFSYDDLAFDAVCAEFAKLSLAQHRIQTPFHEIQSCRTWLKTCTTTHAGCKPRCSGLYPVSLLEIVMGTGSELLCQLRSFETFHEHTLQYVALSYVWSESQAFVDECRQELMKGQSLAVDKLPTVLKDAVALTSILGIRQVWIDSLCIKQTDKQEHWETVNHMGAIYANACLTIVSLTGEGGLPGISSQRSRSDFLTLAPYISTHERDFHHKLITDEIKPSKWCTRGWTYQEALLSTRTLVFTDRGVYFECSGSKATSTFPRGLDPFSWEAVYPTDHYQKRPYMHRFTSLFCQESDAMASERRLAYDVWSVVVTEYTKRPLTCPTDRLVAISGIAKTVELSINDTCLAGLWTGSLPWALLWRAEDPGSNERLNEFPSWSWAGWSGKIIMPRYRPGTPLLTVLDISVSEKDECVEGSITLRGPVIPPRNIPTADSADVGMGFWPLNMDLDNDSGQAWSSGLFVLLVWKEDIKKKIQDDTKFNLIDTQFHGILLSHSGAEEDNLFRRVGICQLNPTSTTAAMLDTYCRVVTIA